MTERLFTHRGTGELDMTGCVQLAGPQAVSELPAEIVKMFHDDPLLEHVAMCFKKNGHDYFVLYSKMPGEEEE